MSKKKKKNNKGSQSGRQQKNTKAAVKPAVNQAKDTTVSQAKDTAVNPAPATGPAENTKKPAAAPKAVKKAAAESPHILHPTISYIYIIVLFVLLIAVFLLKLKADNDLKESNSINEQLKATLITASENIALLSQENNEQKKQLEALSLALNARTEIAETQKKEEEESSVPELYPVKGDAYVVSPAADAGAATSDEEMRLRFSMYEGSYAIAAGSGIIEIMSDDGDGFVNIVINHGNGYKTSYTGEGISLKEAGDEIKRGDALMIFTGDNNELVYSISLNGKNVDPVSVMTIDG